LESDEVVCYSPQTLGNGRINDVRDFIYVKPADFDSGKTLEIATEVGRLNETMRKSETPYVLVGPGRWGTADRWLGIPVAWEQICAARVIVETSLRNFVVTPSQGTHFFHNLTALRVGYLTINPNAGGGIIDWDWLASQPAVTETQFLRHLRFARPILIQLDGRSRRGAIYKPGNGPLPEPSRGRWGRGRRAKARKGA
jgi:hypothetical protein